jgi:hypothetical protein
MLEPCVSAAQLQMLRWLNLQPRALVLRSSAH